ncbi:MAG: hypothetical protein M9953_03085 [Thermomicrobiales bacterium]|nr:hypothetical protein [Thermomicrobiales bacterium]
MTQLPFPTNHDADDLNDWLDALVTGDQAPPSNEVQAAAVRVHALAATSPTVSTQQEGPPMTATALSLPHGRQAYRRPERNWSTWISAVLVAAILVSLVNWFRLPPANQDRPNIAHAPAGLISANLNPLNSNTAPWTADFDPADCTETSDISEVLVDYSAIPIEDPQSYEIIGDAEHDDAEAAAEQYRAMRGCAYMKSAWAYWTEARINQHPRVLDETSSIELAELQSYFADRYPEQFMAVGDDLHVSLKIWSEWTTRADHNFIGQPIPLAAKLNPDWAVTLADGRIAFPATVMYSSADPAIYLGGLPVDDPVSTVVIVFANVDGTWKYDDSLALCLANCAGGVGNPIDPEIETWVQPSDQQECTAQPLIADLNYDLSDGFPDYSDREYQVADTSPSSTAQVVAQTANSWYGCSFNNAGSPESVSYLTPLGRTNVVLIEQGGYGDPFEIAPYLRQREMETSKLLSVTPNWTQIAVVDMPLAYAQFGMIWTPGFSGTAENSARVTTQEGAFNPGATVTLSDGRVAIGHTSLISINDRGAITYEGNAMANPQFGLILQQHGDLWLVDEILVSQNGALAFTQSDGWWWQNTFDPPSASEQIALAPDEVASTTPSPLDPSSAPWIADFSPQDCTAEHQSQIEISSRVNNAEFGEQSYGIVGPATPADAALVGDAYRAMRGCDDGNTAASYWSDARVGGVPRNLTEANLAELADLQAYFESVYPDQFMTTAVDVVVSNDIQAEWDARAEFDVLGAPIPLSVKINPEWGVELGDGRIAFPATVIYAANDPAIVANGLPVDSPASTVAMVFTYERDGWKYDDSLPLCLANCENGIGNPLDPAVETWSVPPTIAECTTNAMDTETLRERMNTGSDWTANSITIQGPATESDAEAALATYRIADACQRYGLTSESLELYSDQSLQYVSPITRGPSPELEKDEENLALAKQQHDLLRMEIAAAEPRISTMAVSQSFVGRYDIPGTQSVSSTLGNNDDSTASLYDGMATSQGAWMLEDGRIVLPMVKVFDMNDRNAIRYGGSLHDRGSAAILRNVDGEWKIDYHTNALTSFGFSITPSTDAWWWAEEWVIPPFATPKP